ncbi:MAG: hypothetical protein WC223_01480 [Bacteroidales bacterium]|jgi:hypothetical protein
MSKKSNSKEKTITIEVEFPISLDELVIYVLNPKEDESHLFDLLNNNPEIADIKMKKIMKEVIRNKKLNIKVKKIKFDYYDLKSFLMGVAYFKVKLQGTKKELKKIAGEYDKVCTFDWEEYKQGINL